LSVVVRTGFRCVGIAIGVGVLIVATFVIVGVVVLVAVSAITGGVGVADFRFRMC
jgi:hypothetical protein